jgi:alanine-synthesizing transaminase
MSGARFAAALDQARASGRVLLDLTQGDPGRCGLGWDAGELEAILERRGAAAVGSSGLEEAREAIAGYLAGHGASVAPDRIVLVRSAGHALRRLVGLHCDGDGEVLVPVPSRPSGDAGALAGLRPYRLAFEERWRLDRRSIRRAITRRTRAILVGNPADPTGAELSREELAFLEELCGARGLTLLAEESALDSALWAGPTVAGVSRCLAVHVAGLGGVCGLPRLEGDWLAVAGPEALARPLVSRLAELLELDAAASRPGVRAIPPLLGLREAFLAGLRARLARNRATLASASLREAPWTLHWGGGCWAVLQVNPAHDEDELCLALLEEGVALQPGHLAGFPREGYLVVSLLPTPEVFDAALVRLEAQLRRPASAAT